ncbi:MAG: hypothetical protein HKN87_20200 [Saprospiraceae bacterium]|nr:hypothetical protein [Saprospiraceae bacterium]
MWKKLIFLTSIIAVCSIPAVGQGPFRLTWVDNILTISGDNLPGGMIEIWYLEAYCRPGAHDRVWDETVIGHTTELVGINKKRTKLKLRCSLSDGVVVTHRIKVVRDGIEYKVIAINPTKNSSDAHWAQPCIRVGHFTGTQDDPDKYAYVANSFIFLDDTVAFMPTKDWALEARYIPGQVWRPTDVPAADVNPRPLNPHIPSNGLIGCVSGDGKWLMATTWEPWHELFQGVIRCLHSDFRIGGLAAGEKKKLRGKIYLMENDVPLLLQNYHRDFP